MHWPPFSAPTNFPDRKGATIPPHMCKAWVSWSYGLMALYIPYCFPPPDIFFPLSHKALAPVPNLIYPGLLNR